MPRLGKVASRALGSIISSLNAAQASISAYGGTITAIQANVSSQGTAIAAAQASITAQAATISAMQANMGGNIINIGKAASGDITLSVSPATFGGGFAATASFATGPWYQVLTVALKTAAGATHTWFSGAVKCLKIIQTATTGTISSGVGATLTFASGLATARISATSLATANSATITIGADSVPFNVFGASLACVNSVASFST